MNLAALILFSVEGCSIVSGAADMIGGMARDVKAASEGARGDDDSRRSVQLTWRALSERAALSIMECIALAHQWTPLAQMGTRGEPQHTYRPTLYELITIQGYRQRAEDVRHWITRLVWHDSGPVADDWVDEKEAISLGFCIATSRGCCYLMSGPTTLVSGFHNASPTVAHLAAVKAAGVSAEDGRLLAKERMLLVLDVSH